MRNRLFVIVVLTLVSGFWLEAQTQAIDSLRQVIAKTTKEEDKAFELLKLFNQLGPNPKYQEERTKISGEVISIGKTQKNLLLEIRGETAKSAIMLAQRKYDEVIPFLESLEKKAFPLKENYPKASILSYLGQAYRAKNDIESSIAAYQKAIQLSSDNPELKATACFNLAETYFAQGRNEQAMKLYLETAKIGETHHITRLLVPSYYGIANACRLNRDYEKGHEYADKCLKTALSLNDIVGQMRGNLVKSMLYLSQNEAEQSIVYSNKEMMFRKQLKDSSGMAATYQNLAQAQLKLGKNELALQSAKESYRLAMAFAPKSEHANSCLVLGMAEMRVNDFVQSAKHLKEGEEKATTLKSFSLLKDIYNVQMELFSRMGKFEDALRCQSLSSNMRDSMFSVEKNKSVSELRTIYETEKKEKAIQELEQQNKIKSLENERQRLATAQIEAALGRELSEKEKLALSTALEREQKNREIKELTQREQIQALEMEKEQARSSRQRVLFVGTVLVLCLAMLVGLLLFGRYRQKQRNEKLQLALAESQKRLELEQQKVLLEQERTESELKALKSQMNPHFLFNALNSIQDFMFDNDKRQANEYMGKFSTLMRSMLDMSNEQNLYLSDEIKMLSVYMELEQVRFGNSLEHFLYVDEELEPEMILIPSMLIQPYIENCLKHGLFHKKLDRKLWVEFLDENQSTLVVKVRDNGVGRAYTEAIKLNRPSRHKSFATAATSKRLELMNLKRTHHITVETIDLMDGDTPCGTEVILRIPYN